MSEIAVRAVVRKLSSRVTLGTAARDAIAGLSFHPRRYDPGSYLVREGEPARGTCSFVLSGFAYRQKLTRTGARQIVSVLMAGDFIDLQQLFLARADHDVLSLTRLETVEVGREALRDVALGHVAIAQALWIDALVESSIHREWETNLGRRDARTRVAHLLCEFALRAQAAGVADHRHYELPMTQEQLGDATGLTSVHINRTLKTLEAEGLIVRDRRFVSLTDWERIASVADFSARYLHLKPSSDMPTI